MKNCQTVHWVDRETMRFAEGTRSALVWVDYEPGFFSRGRIIRAEAILRWEDKGADNDHSISAADRNTIVSAIKNYLTCRGIPCRVEVTTPPTA